MTLFLKLEKMLHTAVGDKGVTCRYGGDEFIILMNVKSHKEIIDMIDNINKRRHCSMNRKIHLMR